MAYIDRVTEILERAARDAAVVVVDLDESDLPAGEAVARAQATMPEGIVVAVSGQEGTQMGASAIVGGATGFVSRNLPERVAEDLVAGLTHGTEFGMGTSMAPEAVNASRVRHLLGLALETWGETELVDVATLLASELVSNAIRHAGGDLCLVLELQADRLRVEVHDGGAGPVSPGRVGELTEGGRGLDLVDTLSRSWGVSPQPDGKAVWFEVGRALPSD